jgi:hypothetical protein
LPVLSALFSDYCSGKGSSCRASWIQVKYFYFIFFVCWCSCFSPATIAWIFFK